MNASGGKVKPGGLRRKRTTFLWIAELAVEPPRVPRLYAHASDANAMKRSRLNRPHRRTHPRQRTVTRGAGTPLVKRNFLWAEIADISRYRARKVERVLRDGFGDAVPLAVSSLIIPEKKTSEGALVASTSLIWLEIIKALQDDWSLAYKIPPAKWEEIVAGAFHNSGFDQVILTPRSGDHGRDVMPTFHFRARTTRNSRTAMPSAFRWRICARPRCASGCDVCGTIRFRSIRQSTRRK